MSPQRTPFGLQPADFSWLTATSNRAPSQRCVAAFDQNAFAVGDIVLETGATINGMAAVSSAFPQLGPGGTNYSPVGSMYRQQFSDPLLIVAVSPATPSMGSVSPVLAAGVKSGTSTVWVIPCGNCELFVAGDASTPARGEFLGPNEAPLNLFASQLEGGTLFASLAYGAPSGGVSGIALAGNSFTLGDTYSSIAPGRHGELQVLGLASGMPLTPRSMYRVRFRNFR
jgi:hypothetical protein